MEEKKKPIDNKELLEELTEQSKKALEIDKEIALEANEKIQEKKYNVPQAGLNKKAFKMRGALVGSRTLTTNKEIVTTKDLPSPKPGEIRVLFFGGVGEIGKNMYAIEYNDEIVILDCGDMFANTHSHLGIQTTVPNIQYLIDRRDKIKAICISHGHLDHIGGIPILIGALGNPPIYTRRLTIEFIKRNTSEYSLSSPLDYREVESDSVINLSKHLTARFFAVTHTMSDAMGIIIETPTGNICFTGDVKLSHKDGVVDAVEEETYKMFKKHKILLTMADSTNAERPGFSRPEEYVVNTINKIIDDAPGMVIVGSFSSTLERNIKLIEHAISKGKKIVAIGRAMVATLKTAVELGKLNIPPHSIILANKVGEIPREKIVILSTGSQGEEYAGLDQMSGGYHKFIKLQHSDTIVFSSSVIPGNEGAVQILKDKLSRLGPALVTYETSDVHSSGHANKDELKWIHNKINAKFFLPLHGFHYMLTAHGRILEELGMPPENIVIPNNGSIVDITADGERIIHQKYHMPTELTVVDGNAVGEQQEIVLRDRKTLASDGIFVMIVMINQRIRKIRKSPDIVSRGFIYLKESQDLMNRSRIIAKQTTEEIISGSGPINIIDLKKALIKELRKFLVNETQKKPIVIPIIYIS